MSTQFVSAPQVGDPVTADDSLVLPIVLVSGFSCETSTWLVTLENNRTIAVKRYLEAGPNAWQEVTT